MRLRVAVGGGIANSFFSLPLCLPSFLHSTGVRYQVLLTSPHSSINTPPKVTGRSKKETRICNWTFFSNNSFSFKIKMAYDKCESKKYTLKYCSFSSGAGPAFQRTRLNKLRACTMTRAKMQCAPLSVVFLWPTDQRVGRSRAERGPPLAGRNHGNGGR